ncbi:MAG TPA: MBL fold metallo-hydrolase, partial [Minicystis sp.]|nr:MBL fold metallo-hydrolase [Minicystis sp.]
VAAVGCTSPEPSPAVPAADPAVAAAPAAAHAARVHAHAAGEKAFFANAYLVETEHGVVAIDAPFTVTEAKAFRAELDALGKPLLAALVTHAHPDHVNGLGELVRGSNAPIVALAGVDATLREIDGPKRAYWSPIYKDEYPATTAFPTRTVRPREKLVFDGVAFTALDLGAGESADEGVWLVDDGARRVAFVGDLVMNRVHPWLAEGRSATWIAALGRAEQELAGVAAIYPGHGEAGTLEALAWERSYLEAYRAAVKELAHGNGKLDDAAKKALAVKMDAVLPNGRLGALVGMSADSVAAELAAAK